MTGLVVVVARNGEYGRAIALHHGLKRDYILATPRNRGVSLRGITRPDRVIADPHWKVGAKALSVRLVEESLRIASATLREPLEIEFTDEPGAQVLVRLGQDELIADMFGVLELYRRAKEEEL